MTKKNMVSYDQHMEAIQYTDTFNTEADARSAYDFLATQVDFLGGRVQEPVTRGWWEPASADAVVRPWKVQVFFSAEGVESVWLPDGCRLVTILDSQRSTLGIREGVTA